MNSINLRLNDSVNHVSQVSDTRAKALNKLNIFTVRDLINHFPRNYLDLTKVVKIGNAASGNTYTISATVHKIEEKEPKPGMRLIEITLVDDSGTLIVTMFRQAWLKKILKVDYQVAVAGKLEFKFGFKRMTNPHLEILSNNKDVSDIAKIVPVHGATAGLSAAWLRRIIANALKYIDGLEGFVPNKLVKQYRLMDYYKALCKVHFPETMKDVMLAKRTLKYSEILLIQTYMMKSSLNASRGCMPITHKIDGPKLSKLIERLPYDLTRDQNLALSEISAKMASDDICKHLVFGDVGSGKTVLAACAIAISADSGYQSMMMAPTEILVQQHEKTFRDFGIKFDVLTSSTKNRDEILEKFRNGEIDLLLGTHALLEDDVLPKNLSLVVIDEQQRFGVEQRSKLIKKSTPLACDTLFLSATPIPRTLALTLYGDLSFSYLKQIPVGTANRTTRVLHRDNSSAAYDTAFDALERGEQVFVVCPLVGVDSQERDERAGVEYGFISVEEDGDFKHDNVKAATTHAAILQNKVFTNYEVGLLHGRMSSEDKAQVINEFSNGKIDVLVCTTVVEVGIDIAGATVMIIEDADRFGLAQLHQLRGRVGRSSKPSNIFLISSSKSKPAIERLSAMEKTNDGTKLAAYDLSLRHEGDILGNRQHGTGILKLIQVEKDKAIIETAHKDAENIIETDPELKLPEHRMLSFELSQVF
ncbi:MAG: ATP-dependent DNA helicase RecG [Coriobacteriia bacterium]|nr:ATP-dependent DNA helicase RecG [Coriobacteriia bacterium]